MNDGFFLKLSCGKPSAMNNYHLKGRFKSHKNKMVMTWGWFMKLCLPHWLFFVRDIDNPPKFDLIGLIHPPPDN